MDNKLNGRILIVDDSPINLEILSTALSELYEVATATNGATALKLINRKLVDIILLDIEMPEMDGYEVCRRIKADTATNMIPIIFVTALSGIEEEVKGLELGAVDFITKPFNVEIAKIRIKNQLELKNLRDNLEQKVAERTQELELTQDTVIECIIRMGEFRNTELGGHIIRTQAYVKIMAEELKHRAEYSEIFTEKYMRLLLKCVPMHDIGKVVISDEILLKAGKLTPCEFEIIKKHTIAGKEILMSAEKKLGPDSFLHLAMQMAVSHHERWDGKGYPYGLAREDIPLPGRLMAIADVYDALISVRVYKTKMSHEEAMKIIIDGRGQQFDPLLVDIFVRTHNEFREISQKNTDY